MYAGFTYCFTNLCSHWNGVDRLMSKVYYVINKDACIEICKQCQAHEVCNTCPYWLRSDRYGFCDIARQFGYHPYEWKEGGMYEKCIAPGKFKLANMTDVFLEGIKEGVEYVVMGR